MEAFFESIDHHGWWSPLGHLNDVLLNLCIQCHVRLPVSGGLSLKICLNPSIFDIAVKSREINIVLHLFLVKLLFFFSFIFQNAERYKAKLKNGWIYLQIHCVSKNFRLRRYCDSLNLRLLSNAAIGNYCTPCGSLNLRLPSHLVTPSKI